MGRHSLFRDPPHLPLVAPSILSADFARMGEECEAVLSAGADLLHLDVMDGHFVPNLTMGPAMVRALRRRFPDTFLDVHLMVTDPAQYVEAFSKAGADHLTFHIEVMPEPCALAEQIRAAGMTVGLAVNPPTEASAIQPFVDAFDLILVMSVNPGYSGQSFIADVLDKVRAVRPLLRENQRLQMDGGINSQTVGECREAGCDTLVAASAIFGSSDYGRVIDALRGAKQRAARSG